MPVEKTVTFFRGGVQRGAHCPGYPIRHTINSGTPRFHTMASPSEATAVAELDVEAEADRRLYDSVNTSCASELNASDVLGFPAEEELGVERTTEYFFQVGADDSAGDADAAGDNDNGNGNDTAVDNDTADDNDVDGEAKMAVLLRGVSSPGDESDIAMFRQDGHAGTQASPDGGDSPWTAPSAVANERELQLLLARIPGRRDLPDLARPVEPMLLPSMTPLAKLAVIQKFIESFEYNYAGVPFVTLRKDRGILSVMSSAKEIIAKALPIQCIEAVFLGVYLTRDMKEVWLARLVRGSVSFACAHTAVQNSHAPVHVCRLLTAQLDRYPVSFKSNVNGHTYRHIVLVIKCKVWCCAGARVSSCVPLVTPSNTLAPFRSHPVWCVRASGAP